VSVLRGADWLCDYRRQVDGRVVGGKEGEFRMDD